MTQQVGDYQYPGFLSMKQLGVSLLPPGWDISPSQGNPPPSPSISSGFRESSPAPSYTPLTSDLMPHVYSLLKLLSILQTKVWEKLLWHWWLHSQGSC